MASFFCHVFGGTKRFRLERIVRARHALGSSLATAAIYLRAHRFIAVHSAALRILSDKPVGLSVLSTEFGIMPIALSSTVRAPNCSEKMPSQ